MDLEDVTPDNFFKKFTYSSDPEPGNKIVMSNGTFVQCAISLRLVDELIRLRGALK